MGEAKEEPLGPHHPRLAPQLPAFLPSPVRPYQLLQGFPGVFVLQWCLPKGGERELHSFLSSHIKKVNKIDNMYVISCTIIKICVTLVVLRVFFSFKNTREGQEAIATLLRRSTA